MQAVKELAQYRDSQDIELLEWIKESDSSRMVRETAEISLSLLGYAGVDRK